MARIMSGWIAIVGVGFTSIAMGQQAADTDAVTVVRRHVDYDVHADGAYSVVVEYALTPNKSAAINAVGQQVIGYQEGMQELEIQEAYTLKKDGKRIDVPNDRIVTQAAPGFANTPLYTDMKVKRMVFSDLAVGDQVVYRYKRTVMQPLFPGHFFDDELFPASRRYDDVRITLKHPKSYAIQVATRGLAEEATRDQDGDVIREWRYRNERSVPEERSAVSPFDRDAVFRASSFKAWGDIAKAYDARAREQAKVTPEIKKLADTITKNIKGKRFQAEEIYAWVTANIRYVAVYLGAGGYVPHTAESILQNRYGDCKDYTTLLGALLDAKGIANEPVIINAATAFKLPEVPTPAAFNHAIVYLPEFRVYLDATARTLPFGSLALLEANKAALHTRSFKEILHTPNFSASDRLLQSKSTASVGSDGTLKGATIVSAVGEMKSELEPIVMQLDNPQLAKRLSMGLLSIEGFTGAADFKKTRVHGLLNSTSYESDYAIDNWINLPGPGAVQLPSGLLSSNPLRFMARQMLNTPAPQVDHLCFPGTFDESGTLQLPKEIKVLSVPKDAEYAGAFAQYRSHYTKSDQGAIEVSRHLELNFPSTVCSPETSLKLREVFEVIRRDTSAQMTYE